MTKKKLDDAEIAAKKEKRKLYLSAYQRAYRVANPEKIKAYAAVYRAINAEREIYRAANREKEKAQRIAYREELNVRKLAKKLEQEATKVKVDD